jgi:NADH-quinone oxidoreductase subunit M
VVEGVVDLYPWVGTFVVVAAALNSMAIMHGYFRLFTGTEHRATADLKARANEKIAVWVLTILILGGGLVPQPGVASRFHAAVHLLDLEHPAGFVDEANVAEESNAEQSVVIESGGVP